MKKIALGLSLMFVLAFAGYKKLNAGLPQEQGAQLNGAFWHAQIVGSSSTVVNSSIAVTLAGNTGYQNCFTRFLIQISSTSSFNVYDGTSATNTQLIAILGAGLGTNPSNTLNLAEDHLGPVCGSINNATLIIVSTGATSPVTGVNNTFNYEGYITAGPGSTKN